MAANKIDAGLSPRSLHGRNDELGALLYAGWPARRHCLGLGVEADRVRAVLVEVAEARALPAAEGVVGERHRDGEIHPDHADLDTADEITRGIAVAREDGDAVAVFVLGGQPYRLLVILGAHDGEDGTENLLLVDAHLGRHLVEQTAAHEIALLIALELKAAAVDNEPGAFLYAEIDVAFDFFQVRPRDHRSVIGLRVARGTDLQALDPRHQLFQQNVRRLLADRHGDG